jgi:sialate O-acetylesterase
MIRLFSTQVLLNEDHFRPEDKWQVCAEETKGEWSALAYFVCNEIAQKKGIAVGAVACYLGASTIESWLPRGLPKELGLDVALSERGENSIWNTWNRGGGILYDFAFLNQVVPFPFSGVAWYQGESNSSVAESAIYDRLLCALIDRWRADLCDEALPFVIVQIADYMPPTQPDWIGPQEGWRAVQEAQARVPSMRKAVITVPCRDICETDDIHPKSKKELGGRIAQAFMKLV